MAQKMFESGRMTIGCNYWASHAGTAMWSNWRPEVVDADFAKLAAGGLQLVRVFPLWPDFQPLTRLLGGGGHPAELRLGEAPLDGTPAGRAGVDPEMMKRFRVLADLAQKHGLAVEVSLLNGWMSGRLFVPPAFADLNVIADPQAMHWEARFVSYFVATMKDHPAIAVWSPGNECNCMGHATRHQAWLWMNTITAAIRQADPSRPITSGMHSLAPAADAAFENKSWTIQDQGELSDFLTTHPYPEFTPHAQRDPIHHFRNVFHATAESCFYGDIGGKPCLAEELGTLAAMFAGEEVKASYIRNTLFNLWAHDRRALLWWCAFDQLNLEHAPYDWTAYERELGLFTVEGQPKPVLGAMGGFRRMVESLPVGRLPPFRRQAVCIVTPGQDAWGNAWSAFLLAKQAGFDIEFQYGSDPLKPATLYLLPGVCGSQAVTRRCWLELMERVQQGATLYVSLDDGVLAPFNSVFGVELQHRSQRTGAVEWTYASKPLRAASRFRSVLQPRTASVLAQEADGNPVFLRQVHGKGAAYLLTAPIEKHLAETPGLFPAASEMPYFRIYEEMAAPALQDRLARTGNPLITATEHFISDREAAVVLVNNQSQAAECHPVIRSGWRLDKVLHGGWKGAAGRIGANDGAILKLVGA